MPLQFAGSQRISLQFSDSCKPELNCYSRDQKKLIKPSFDCDLSRKSSIELKNHFSQEKDTRPGKRNISLNDPPAERKRNALLVSCRLCYQISQFWSFSSSNDYASDCEPHKRRNFHVSRLSSQNLIFEELTQVSFFAIVVFQRLC